MQMKYKKDDFSPLPVDSTASTYDLICYKAEPSVGSPQGGASILHFPPEMMSQFQKTLQMEGSKKGTFVLENKAQKTNGGKERQ